MKRVQGISAVFFDLDGTLLDTLSDIARAVNYALQNNSFSGYTVNEYRAMVGWGLDRTIRMALPDDCNDQGVIEKIRHEMKTEYARNPVVETAPYPGILEMLGVFQELGTPLGILSNKDDAIARKVVQGVLGAFTFTGVYGSSAEVPPKPDPTGFRLLLEKSNLNAEDVLFVGDTAMDMKTALEVGSYPLGVSWGYRTAQQLIEAGARKVVHEPREIIEVFQRLALDRSSAASL